MVRAAPQTTEPGARSFGAPLSTLLLLMVVLWPQPLLLFQPPLLLFQPPLFLNSRELTTS